MTNKPKKEHKKRYDWNKIYTYYLSCGNVSETSKKFGCSEQMFRRHFKDIDYREKFREVNKKVSDKIEDFVIDTKVNDNQEIIELNKESSLIIAKMAKKCLSRLNKKLDDNENMGVNVKQVEIWNKIINTNIKIDNEGNNINIYNNNDDLKELISILPKEDQKIFNKLEIIKELSVN